MNLQFTRTDMNLVFSFLYSLLFAITAAVYYFANPNPTTQLYNLSSDPTESINLSNEANYQAQISDFVFQTEQWLPLVHKGESPAGGNSSAVWTARGGLGPWIPSSFVPTVVQQKYSLKNAPNLVFVLIDDWGYNDFGLRSTYLNWTTSAIDNLANEGILLENYVTYQLCSPSRSAFLTGRYALRTGVTDVIYELPLQEFLLSQELKSAGYRTYAVAKWHVGFSTEYHTPNQRGFESR